MSRYLSVLVLSFVLLTACLITACRLGNGNDAGPMVGPSSAPIGTGPQAQILVDFHLADLVANPLDRVSAATPTAGLRAEVYDNVTVGVTLSVINFGPQPRIDRLVATATAVQGRATLALSVPVSTVIAEITVHGLNTEFPLEFRGALDLVAGTNVLAVHPTESGLRQDLLAEVLQRIADDPALLTTARPGLTARLQARLARLDRTRDVFTVYQDLLAGSPRSVLSGEMPTTTPQLAITVPASGSVVAPQTRVAVTGVGSATLAGITEVTLLAGPTPIASGTTLPLYGTLYPAAPGTYSLTLQARLGTGQLLESVPITIGVNEHLLLNTDPLRNLPPIAISNVQAQVFADFISVYTEVSWTTDRPTRYRLDYGLDNNYGKTIRFSGTPTTTHKATLPKLQMLTRYHYRILALDAATTAATYADDRTFDTPVQPDRGGTPVNDVAIASITDTSVYVTWNTPAVSTGRVVYGTTTQYGQVFPDPAPACNRHAVTLTGLAPETRYYVNAESIDNLGQIATGAGVSFVTVQPPPEPGPVTADDQSTAFTVLRFSAVTSPCSFTLDLTGPLGTERRENGCYLASGTNFYGLDKLTANTNYSYTMYLQRWGSAGAITTTSGSFVSMLDTVVPQIESAGLTGEFTDIEFLAKTDEPARLRLLYGPATDSINTLIADTTTYQTDHVCRFTVAPGDVYTKAVFTDPFGNHTSELEMYHCATTTTGDRLSPTIANLTLTRTGSTTLRVSWATDEPTSSGVCIGPYDYPAQWVPLSQHPALGTSHVHDLAGVPLSGWVFVASRDEAGNDRVVRGPFYSVAPPTIESSFTAVSGENEVGVRFTTSIDTTAKVEWGTTPALGNTVNSAATARAHAVTITGLDANAPLYGRIVVDDGFGQTASKSFSTRTPLTLALGARIATETRSGHEIRLSTPTGTEEFVTIMTPRHQTTTTFQYNVWGAALPSTMLAMTGGSLRAAQNLSAQDDAHPVDPPDLVRQYAVMERVAARNAAAFPAAQDYMRRAMTGDGFDTSVRAALAANAVASAPATKVGEYETLYIHDDRDNAFFGVQARLMYRSAACKIYLDRNPCDGFVATYTLASDIRSLGTELSTKILPFITTHYGPPFRWAQGDNRVNVCISAVVDACECHGWFNGHDFTGDQYSNRRNIVYVRPRNHGESSYSWRMQMRFTMTHELQHLANYVGHAINNASTSEETWLDEALAEEAAARYDPDIAAIDQRNGRSADAHCIATTPLCLWEGDSVHYGMSGLFGIYLRERLGAAASLEIAQGVGGRRGRALVDAVGVAQGGFSGLHRDFTRAMARLGKDHPAQPGIDFTTNLGLTTYHRPLCFDAPVSTLTCHQWAPTIIHWRPPPGYREPVAKMVISDASGGYAGDPLTIDIIRVK